MARPRRVLTTGAVVLSLMGTPRTLFATDVLSLPDDVIAATAPSTSAETATASRIDDHNVAPNEASVAQALRAEPLRFTDDTIRAAVVPIVGGAALFPRHGFGSRPTAFTLSAAQIYAGPPYPYYRRNHDGSIAAMMIGAAAAITGTAVLVYANRPECSMNQLAGGCGYGTKVVGSAVLAGGVAGLVVGALTWH